MQATNQRKGTKHRGKNERGGVNSREALTTGGANACGAFLTFTVLDFFVNSSLGQQINFTPHLYPACENRVVSDYDRRGTHAVLYRLSKDKALPREKAKTTLNGKRGKRNPMKQKRR